MATEFSPQSGISRILDLRGSRGVQVGDHNSQVNNWTVRDPPLWPLQVGVPPRVAVAFQSRVQLLSALIDSPASVSQVVAGDGGVGKSQLAAAAFRAAQATGVQLAVWVAAGSEASLIAGLGDAGLAVDPNALDSTKDTRGLARGFLAWLGTTRRSWLVVLDDVTDPAHLAGWWPTGPSGRVIVTTRRQDLALPNAGVVPVSNFEPAESATYLAERLVASRHLLDRPVELGAALGHRPVALAQAAAYLLAQHITCSAYLTRLGDRRRRLDELLPGHAAADEYAYTTAATALLALDAADQLPPAGLARPALELAALLDPNGAPAAVWQSEAARTYLSRHRSAGSVPRPPTGRRRIALPRRVRRAPAGDVSLEDADGALRNLHRLSLIAQGPGEPSGTDVRVHPLTQRAVIEMMDARIDTAVFAAAVALAEVWNRVENDLSYSSVLRRNTNALSTQHSESLWRSGVYPILSKAGRSLGESGLAGDAVAYFSAVHQEADDRLGPDHLFTLHTRHELAFFRGEEGDVAGAAAELSRLLEDQRRLLGPDDRSTLATRNNLAFFRGQAGDVDGALAELTGLLEDQRRLLGTDDSDTFCTRNNMAFWRGDGGDVVGALAEFTSLLEDCRRVRGSDDRYTLSIRNNIAYLRAEAGDVDGAVSVWSELLEDERRLLGSDHPLTLTVRQNLAFWRGKAGDLDSANALLTGALEDLLRVLGPDHPNTLRTRSNLAQLHGKAGDPIDAVAELTGVLEDQRRALGPDHPDTLATRANLVYWRGMSGAEDVTRLITEFASVFEDQRRVLGPDHPNPLTTRCYMSSLRAWNGDIFGAVAELTELLEDLRRVLGPDHRDTRGCYKILDRMWGAMADVPSTREDGVDVATEIADLEGVLVGHREVFGPDHRQTLGTRTILALVCAEGGDLAGAIRDFERLLIDAQRLFGPDHPGCLMTRESIAKLRWRSGDAEGALVELIRLLSDCIRVLGADHPGTLNARKDIAVIRRDGDDLPGAITEFERLLTAQLRVLGSGDPQTLDTRSGLAFLHRKAGDVASAAYEFHRLLSDQLRLLGPDHPNTLVTRNNLASMRGEGGDVAGAIIDFEQLLTDRLRVLGPDHPDTLTTRSNIAFWRGMSGKVGVAIVEFERLLKDRRRVLGPNDPETLATQKDIAYLKRVASGAKSRRRGR